MPFDKTTGVWTETDLNAISQQGLDYLDESFLDFNTNVGSNPYVMTRELSRANLANDSQAGITYTLMLQQINEAKIVIEGSKSVTPSGIRSAFLSLAPLVQKCSIIQATRDNENWYIFLELNKPFVSVTSQEKSTLLEMGSSRQGCGKLSSKYPDPTVAIDGEIGVREAPSPIITIEGKGMIDASYQEEGAYAILNEIQQRQIPKLLIKIIVLKGYEDSVHYIDDRLDILNDFSTQFDAIQGIKVDFLKIDYAPIIHSDTRKPWMYDFNFYDNTDPANLLIQNYIIVNEYQYLTLGTDDPVKISFYTQGTNQTDGTYTDGDLIA